MLVLDGGIMAIPIPESPNTSAVNLLILNSLAEGLLEAKKKGWLTTEQFEQLYLHGLKQPRSRELINLL